MALRHRLGRSRRRDEGVALIMSLIVIMLASALSIAVAGSILAQVKPSQLTRKLTRTLNAAEAGIDVAQKNIRAAEAEGSGTLPCGPFRGTVSGDGTARYDVTVRYYDQDPTGRPQGWLDNSAHWLHKIEPCPEYGSTSGNPGAWWALVTSTGSAAAVPGTRPGAANRTLTAIIKPSDIPPGPRSFTGATSGDGWEALFFEDNIYNVVHHYPATTMTRGQMIDCHNKFTGASCPGYPTYASSEPGPFGPASGLPDDLFTGQSTTAAVDRDRSRVYIPAGKGTNEIGVACLDFSTHRSCGFTRLATVSTDNTIQPQVTGGAQIGTRYYIGGPDATIYCFDYSTEAACAGYPPAGVRMPTFSDSTNPWFGDMAITGNSIASFDDRYVFGYFQKATDGKKKDLMCLDTRTNTVCPNFPKTDVGFYYDCCYYNTSLAPILGKDGSLTDICAAAKVVTVVEGVASDPLFPPEPYQCFSVLTGERVTPPWPKEATAAPGHFARDGVLLLGTKVYFAMTSAADANPPLATTYSCWDFAEEDRCAGFTSSTSGRKNAAYTLRQDPFEPTCIWEVGHMGNFEFFHRDTGQVNVC